MESISVSRVRTAICDQEGFYPFRSLLTGQLASLDELALAERFARAVVLHDAMEMELEPMPAQDEEREWRPEEIAAGGRNVIVALGPDLRQYGELFSDRLGPDRTDLTRVELSPTIHELARDLSGAGPGDVQHKAYLGYLHRLTANMRRGGSIVCGGPAGVALRERASRYPEALFSTLDRDLQALAREAHDAHVGVVVPPVLSIVLTRIHRRDDIVDALLNLRREWREPRERAWALIEELRTAQTVAEMRDVERELEDASSAFSPARAAVPIKPARVLWDLVVDSGKAATTLAGGNFLSTLIAAVGSVTRIFREMAPARNYLFRRGALDLARRVRSEVLRAEGTPDLLDRFLTDEERKRLQR